MNDSKLTGNDDLVHRDGHRVRTLGERSDEAGRFLLIEHAWTRPGPMVRPHWHPVLTESFAIEEGRIRFRVYGRDFSLGPGEGVTVRPRQVHRIWNESEGRLVQMHEIRPPGRHREM